MASLWSLKCHRIPCFDGPIIRECCEQCSLNTQLGLHTESCIISSRACPQSLSWNKQQRSHWDSESFHLTQLLWLLRHLMCRNQFAICSDDQAVTIFSRGGFAGQFRSCRPAAAGMHVCLLGMSTVGICLPTHGRGLAIHHPIARV